MRLFERCIYKNEIADVIYYSIDSDQYAYKVGHNSTMALIKCKHTWLKELESGAKYVRVLSFDLSEFLKINPCVPQGTVLGPILFSIMVNDIEPVNPINELCKFADDITVEAPGYDEDDTGTEEVEHMKSW